MNIIKILRRVNDSFSNQILSKKIPSYKKQTAFLYSFSEPKNDMQRSYYQYLCQLFSCENRISILLKNIVSVVLIPVYLHKKYQTPIKTKKEIIYITINSKHDMLPNKYLTDNDVYEVHYDSGMYLNEDDIKFIEDIRKEYKNQFYFIYKIIIKIGFYSWAIQKYQPEEILVNAETSFTSSVLTLYCERKSIVHTNVMHGDKVFWIRDAFFRFTNCYVWTEYHKNLFLKLRSTSSKYIIEEPQGLLIDSDSYNIEESEMCDYKFYLGYETKQTLNILNKQIRVLENNGKTVKIRPHPIYTDAKLVTTYFREDQIENTRQIEIGRSIASARNVVSIYSTVFRQAKHMGKGLVVNDCSDRSKYLEMLDLKFWLYQESHLLLSKVVYDFSTG